MKRLPKFRDFDRPGMPNPYGWDYGYGKARKRITFRTKAQKKKFREEFEKKYISDRSALVLFDPEKWRRYVACERTAGSIDALEAAANQIQRRQAMSSQHLLFSQALKAKFEDLERMNARSPQSVNLYGTRFIEALGDRGLLDYTQEEIQQWTDRLLQDFDSQDTANNHLKAVRSVFNRAVKQGLLERSPAQYITMPRRKMQKREELIAPDDTEKLLNHIWKINKAEAACYALLFFVGLRVSLIAPSPVKRLAKEYILPAMVDVKSHAIIIPKGITKTGAALIIDEALAPDCLWPWLEHVGDAVMPIPAQTFTKRRRAYCKAVGINWSANAHRRSCASYYAALHGKKRASDLLGNTEKMIVEHYQVATFKKTAEEYFSITPNNE